MLVSGNNILQCNDRIIMIYSFAIMSYKEMTPFSLLHLGKEIMMFYNLISIIYVFINRKALLLLAQSFPWFFWIFVCLVVNTIQLCKNDSSWSFSIYNLALRLHRCFIILPKHDHFVHNFIPSSVCYHQFSSHP